MIAKDFICAGKAVFTVSNPEGVRYTYRITRKPAEGKFREAWFVSLLTGPDNTSDYTYMGLFSPTTGEVRLTTASRYTNESQPVRVIRWALAKVWAGADLPAGYGLHHEGRCGRCGRALTVPESIDSGIGPECAKMMELV